MVCVCGSSYCCSGPGVKCKTGCGNAGCQRRPEIERDRERANRTPGRQLARRTSEPASQAGRQISFARTHTRKHTHTHTRMQTQDTETDAQLSDFSIIICTPWVTNQMLSKCIEACTLPSLSLPPHPHPHQHQAEALICAVCPAVCQAASASTFALPDLLL